MFLILIRTTLRSFQISYFSTFSFSYFFINLSVLMQGNSLVDSLHGIPVSYCFSYGTSYYFPRSLRLPNWPTRKFCTTGDNGKYRDCIAFAVYCNSQATMDIMFLSPRLKEPSSGQSRNLLNNLNYSLLLLILNTEERRTSCSR